ncbi:hypothetical protein OMP38_02220 [Cohnella ginsengisoli]|uniref:t-SNARE coiled-coil homology domain-containing protein n=1 Tax=Cohnella ginsengisoli TaxID=425004 RepID=A0A9X4KD15_9BACL|nr:hypothetical protein [Cohnella ginsengisoli]MDG0789791.1 hypothetical protein [Cohnella ginsengisoli]
MSEQVLETILVELKGMSKRFDAIDRRLDGIDHRLDGIDNRLDGIDHRLDGMDARLDGIDRRLDGLEATLNQVAAAVMDTNDRLSKVTDIQEEHAIALDSLQTEQSRQGKAIEALAFRVLEHDTEIRALKRAK